MTRVLAIVLALSLSACAEELPELPNGTTLSVTSMGKDAPPVRLRPESTEYKRLMAWLNENRTGWTQHYATPPGTGILVMTDRFVIHFVGNKAIVRLQHGAYEKDIQESEYEYLRAAGV